MVNSNLFCLNVSVLVDFSEKVVTLLMASFISSDSEDHISHGGTVVESVVINDFLWCWSIFPMCHTSSFSVNVMKYHGVVFEGCFFKISMELVAESGTDEISYEES